MPSQIEVALAWKKMRCSQEMREVEVRELISFELLHELRLAVNRHRESEEHDPQSRSVFACFGCQPTQMGHYLLGSMNGAFMLLRLATS